MDFPQATRIVDHDKTEEEGKLDQKESLKCNIDEVLRDAEKRITLNDMKTMCNPNYPEKFMTKVNQSSSMRVTLLSSKSNLHFHTDSLSQDAIQKIVERWNRKGAASVINQNFLQANSASDSKKSLAEKLNFSIVSN